MAIIHVRDADGEVFASFRMDGEILDEDSLQNLFDADMDSVETADGEWENSYTLDVIEDKILQKYSNRELVEELKRRLGE